MKKRLSKLLLLGAAVLAMSSCTNDEMVQNNQSYQHRLTIIAENPGILPDSRTEIGYNEKGDVIPMWSSSAMTNWSATPQPDCLETIIAAEAPSYRFFYNKTEPSAIAEFTQGEEAKDLIEALNKFKPDTIYFGKGFDGIPMGWNRDGKANKLEFSFRSASINKIGTFPSGTDALISEPIKTEDVIAAINSGTPLKPRFKRINGIIRINLKQGSDIDLSEFKIGLISISTINNAEKNFSGEICYDIRTGEIQQFVKKTAVCRSSIKDPETGETLPMCIPGKVPAYICSLPIELKAGEGFVINIEDLQNNIIFKKTLTAPEGGLKVESGKITTLNVTLNASDRAYPSRYIFMKEKGTLTEERFEKAVKDSRKNQSWNDVVVVGDINAADIDIMVKCLAKGVTDNETVSLDLSRANIIGGDGSQYANSAGDMVSLEQSNSLGAKMFVWCNRLTKLVLPESLEYIPANAIYNCENLMITEIGSNIKKIDAEAIKVEYHGSKLIFKASPDVATDIADGFFTNEGLSPESSELELNPAWFEETCTGKPVDTLWKGYTWKTITKIASK